jgi:hypothetical protein
VYSNQLPAQGWQKSTTKKRGWGHYTTMLRPEKEVLACILQVHLLTFSSILPCMPQDSDGSDNLYYIEAIDGEGGGIASTPLCLLNPS